MKTEEVKPMTPDEQIDDGGPAFPQAPEYDTSANGVLREVAPGSTGLSLRDYFAAKALAGLCSSFDERSCPQSRAHEVEKWRVEISEVDAAYCYRMADAMLAARRARKDSPGYLSPEQAAAIREKEVK